MIKCGRLRFQFCTNAAIYPRLRVGFNSHSGYNISYTLPNKLSQRLCVYVNIILGSYPGTYPSSRDQNNLEERIPIGQTSVE
jgi:hypothetical protein